MRGRADVTLDNPYLPYTGTLPLSRATSRASAGAMSDRAATERERVFRAIAEAGDAGLTDREVQQLLGMDGNTERPRRVELMRAGRIHDALRVRKTASGRDAVVWVARLTEV